MLELLNSNTLFATIAMLRPEKEGVFLLVEGNDDLFTIRQHVDDERVTLLSGLGGKSDLVAASNLVESNGIERVYFLIDKDYDEYITPEVGYGEDIVTSDGHDVVMDLMLVDREVMCRVIRAHTRNHANGGATINASAVLSSAIDLAFPIGVLRLLNVDRDWGLNLRNFPFGKLTSCSPSPEEIVDIALRRSAPLPYEKSILPALTSAMTTYASQALAIVGDHDCFAAIVRVLADEGYTSTAAGTFASSFLAAVDCDMLQGTGWFDAISAKVTADTGSSCFECPCGVVKI